MISLPSINPHITSCLPSHVCVQNLLTHSSHQLCPVRYSSVLWWYFQLLPRTLSYLRPYTQVVHFWCRS